MVGLVVITEGSDVQPVWFLVSVVLLVYLQHGGKNRTGYVAVVVSVLLLVVVVVLTVHGGSPIPLFTVWVERNNGAV